MSYWWNSYIKHNFLKFIFEAANIVQLKWSPFAKCLSQKCYETRISSYKEEIKTIILIFSVPKSYWPWRHQYPHTWKIKIISSLRAMKIWFFSKRKIFFLSPGEVGERFVLKWTILSNIYFLHMVTQKCQNCWLDGERRYGNYDYYFHFNELYQ